MNEQENDSSAMGEQRGGDATPKAADITPEFSPREPHHNPIGAIIGTVILFALLILGGLYVYGSRLSATQPDNEVPESQQSGEFSEQDEESDDLEVLETELEALEDFESMGTDLESSFDAEFAE